MSAKLSPELEAKIHELAEKEGKSFVEMEVELVLLGLWFKKRFPEIRLEEMEK